MTQKKTITISLIVIILLVIFFWPKTSPKYTYDCGSEDLEFINNTKCSCIGIQTLDPEIPQCFWLKWRCYGIYLNCHEECQKKISGEWEEISCE